MNKDNRNFNVAPVPEGADALMIAEVSAKYGKPVLHVARDDARVEALLEALKFFAPKLKVLSFPAWDCLPYDRVSPNPEITSRRIETLTDMAYGTPQVVIATVNSLLQRVLPKEEVKGSAKVIKKGDKINRSELLHFLAENGYSGASTVIEKGDFAVRGSIIDIFPSNLEKPVRIDCFGDEVELIKFFDPLTQITESEIQEVKIISASEIKLTNETIERFSERYIQNFSAAASDNPVYQSVLESRKIAGLEHWQPLFYKKMETIFDYLPEAIITHDFQDKNLIEDRFAIVDDYYDARLKHENISVSEENYNPLSPEELYLTKEELDEYLDSTANFWFSPFYSEGGTNINTGYSHSEKFHILSKQQQKNPFEVLREWQQQRGKKVVIACYSEGSRARITNILKENHIAFEEGNKWQDILTSSANYIVTKLRLRSGFETDKIAVVTEEDIFGERFIRRAVSKKKSNADKILYESYSLQPGEIIVHEEYGIGRFEGLETLSAGGKNHDCLRLVYSGGDKLFIPVENIDVISRYGQTDGNVELDRLGAASWQARKARLKERIKLAAAEIIKVAAERAVQVKEELHPVDGFYNEFCARFPYSETDDQLRAIEDITEDFAAGKLMNRLICGDVGFGKTEVAVRAAFIALADRVRGIKDGQGGQVAIITPTTLLCRQHYKTFRERFADVPVKILQLSRMVTGKQATEVKNMMASGEVDIVIGTHALLAKTVAFKNLSLLIIDEEQHFGVAQKEYIKKMQADTHVLALSATPIPRTLQMSLTGIKDLSLIATPPIDRLAVRTYVMPFDPIIIKEAVMRERNRGGKIFYVCPRIKDLEDVEKKIRKVLPEVRIAVAHGKLKPAELDKIMNEFSDGRFDILLSTSIIESGIDIPTANTLIVHKSEMFGLSQLYQLRGRVGRSNIRAYSYFTVTTGKQLTKEAMQRLEVMQKLDTLGAGFTLATYDMDIRGFGNLLGDQQSGNIKEVGLELYQQMLQEAIEEIKWLKTGAQQKEIKDNFSPQINLGVSVLIPESYIADLGLRLGMYKRIADLKSEAEIEGIAAELVDRFGALPEEVEHLLQVIKIKQLCREAGISKVDAGPKGAVVTFRNNKISNPEKLIEYITKNQRYIKLKSDNKLVIAEQVWDKPEERLKGLKTSVEELVKAAA